MTVAAQPPTRAETAAVIAREAALLADLGWMRATSGNLSVVMSRNPLRLLVTASGVDKGHLSPEDMVTVGADGGAVPDDDSGRRPSAEAALHARLAAHTGAGAVVHTHPVAAVRAAELHPAGIELRELEMLKAIGRPPHKATTVVPVVANDQDMDALATRAVAAGRPEVPGVIVAGHGLYTWGRDLVAARRATEALVWLAELVVARG